jgi:hypothetical protein
MQTSKCGTWSLRALCIFSAEHGASRQVWKAAIPRIPNGPGRGTFMMRIALCRLSGCTKEWISYPIAPRFRTCMLARFERLRAISELNSNLREASANYGRMGDDQPSEAAPVDDNDISTEKSRELLLLLTSWYLIIESARARKASDVDYTIPRALRKFFLNTARTCD